MKMRLAWYAGTSTALAAAVVASAFYQRANFYSAMVHLAQSSLSLMVLVNLVFVVYGIFMYGLQRLCFGPLRPTEIEQLYEKAWFAVTETCLAMTIFREEVGPWFLVMFTALVTGKVWGWIGEGRVEILEQQPPANPRLFHTRLGISLFLSIGYDIWLLSYAVNNVIQEARPNMMVMFLFEFAVLTVTSLHTTSRYIISLVEQRVVKTQTRQRLEDRRRHIREQREEILRRRETEGATEDNNEELPDENDVDEMDIEVPGWEAKGHWVLSLDLFADFIKLGLYTTFFVVLVMFYGLPIHIIRDWFMTTRSFLKRLHALIRYRQALKHMEQYPDATVEELGRENTCIICREEMRPWDPTDVAQIERTRAKKLPCGHILHSGCLKSWLERQQVCPTCRRPVARDGQQQPGANNGRAMVFRLGLNVPAGQNQQPPNGQAAGGAQFAPGGAEGEQGNQNRGVRMFNLGPLRLGFAQGGVDEIREMAQRLRIPADAVNAPADANEPLPTPTPTPTVPAQETNNSNLPLEQMRSQLLALGQQVRQEMINANNAAHEVQYLNLLMNELIRLRQVQQQPRGQGQQPATQQAIPGAVQAGLAPLPHQPQGLIHPFMVPLPPGQLPLPTQMPNTLPPLAQRQQPPITRHVSGGYGAAIPAGSPELPEGVVIPPGWSLLPLQRMDGGMPQPADPAFHNTQMPSMGAQDILHSLMHAAPHNPRSRGPSPAPGLGIFAQPGRTPPAATASNPPAESSRSPQPQAQPPVGSADAAIRRQQQQQGPAAPPPHVTAPIPLAPNWGGSAQLFGGGAAAERERDRDRGDRSRPTVFGYQREDTPEPQEEGAQFRAPGPQVSLAAQIAAAAAAAAAAGVDAGANANGNVNGVGVAAAETSDGTQGETEPEARREQQGEGAAPAVNGSTAGDGASRGGPRAVTVEEAEDEDDER